MPIRVNVDETRKLVEVVFEGELTGSDVADLMDRHLRDPSSALPLGLFDLSGVTAMGISSDSVRAAARRVAEHVNSRVEEGKLAIVAPRDLLFGMARMYGILRSESPVEVRVFRQRGEAESWLGLTE
jgi:hypothetical protein